MSDSTRAEVAVPSGTVKQQRVAVAAGDQVGWHIAERDGHSIDFSAMFVRGETVLGVVEETRCASHSGQHVCEQSGWAWSANQARRAGTRQSLGPRAGSTARTTRLSHGGR